MSRTIHRDRPFSAEDIAYLNTRANGEYLIAENKRRFAHLDDKARDELVARNEADDAAERAEELAAAQEAEADQEDSYHPDDVEKVADLTLAKLRSELEAEGLNPKATKKEQEQEGMTEKEILSYRLLNHYDAIRAAAQLS